MVQSLLATDPEHAVLLLDTEGRIVAWMGAATRLFGYTAEEAAGRHVREIFTPRDRTRRQPEEELAVATTAQRAEDDRWHLRQDGAAVWVTGTLTALRDAEGRLLGFAKLMRDRSDLRTHVEALEARLQAASQRLESATLMLHTIGHELRNALAPVHNVTTWLERTETGGPAVAMRAILRRQIAALQRQADDMMDFSRLDTGRLPLRLSSFELQVLLRDIVQGRAAEAAARSVQIELLLPEAPIVLQADRERLQQVVVNLLDNALRHNGPGCRVLVRAGEEPPEAVIRIEDNGIGIAPEALANLFVLFARGPEVAPDEGDGTGEAGQGSAGGAGGTGATTGPGGGMGIGLALAKCLVELHGGGIEARSAGLHKGAMFTVRVPLRAPTSTLPPPLPMASPSPSPLSSPSPSPSPSSDTSSGGGTIVA